jgi:hypothetical protein
MKELQHIITDNIASAVVKQIEKQQKIKTLKPPPGHKCWEFNLLTGEIKEAEFVSTSIEFETAVAGDMSVRKKVLVKPNCTYDTGLNISSVQKKFFKTIRKVVQST